MSKYFGTDGIRGIVGKNVTPKIAFKLGNALTIKTSRPKIIIGRDTRLSGEALSHSFIAGALCGGGYVCDVGIVPTPIISFLVRKLGFDYGLVITASHNPAEHNGLKLFNNLGYKLSPAEEIEIERLFDKKQYLYDGKCFSKPKLVDIYTKYIEGICDLSGLKIALDCSNGATSKIAPKIFKKMGASVSVISNSGNGENINKNCGCLHIDNLKRFMKNRNFDVGFSFDGDGDRCIAIDSQGNEIDGDRILYILAKYSTIESKVVVGTTQTNSAIEESIRSMGKTFVRADVGDKYVLEQLISLGGILGGEKAGHIIILNKNNSGDGILTAVEICKVLMQTGKTLAELNNISLYPQKIVNVAVKDKQIVKNPELLSFIKTLSKNCRINVRASGTEDVIRVMCEAKNEVLVENYLKQIENKIKQMISTE